VIRPSKTHLDGYNFQPFLKGDVVEGPRKEFFYFTDNGDLTAVRYNDWKLSFKTIKGNLFTGTEESTNVPLVTNLRQDRGNAIRARGCCMGRWWGEKTLDDGACRNARRRLPPDF